MTTLAYVVAYLGLVFFLIACIARFMMWSKMPMHVRWELYPVAHEGGGKAAYGGSYLEDTEWWTKKREVSLFGELKVMVPEILFLVALREHNKKLWTPVLPLPLRALPGGWRDRAHARRWIGCRLSPRRHRGAGGQDHRPWWCRSSAGRDWSWGSSAPSGSSCAGAGASCVTTRRRPISSTWFSSWPPSAWRW